MCLICLDLNAGKMTVKEAWRNYDEIYVQTESKDPHKHAVLDLLHKKFRLEHIARVKAMNAMQTDHAVIEN